MRRRNADTLVLFRGQVKRKRLAECIHCGRCICANEYCFKLVLLDTLTNVVHLTTSCCKQP
jgi:hypothetical protein